MSQIIAFFLLLILSPVLILVGIIIRIDSPGPALFWSKRVGKNSILFNMPKFRTMYSDSPVVATDLLQNTDVHITKIGNILRRTSLDELPQLYSILCNQMHFIGPRPALYNQYDLIDLRKKFGVDCLYPGITGYAQVIGRDNVSLEDKVSLDCYYLLNRGIKLDIYILLKTFLVVFSQKNIKH
ncbi:sugar transferase [Polynucleobacter sp. MWH-UH23A]|uniref:sugar transferase n=1 Tax=Polynucleobacter sp. MWH-UH23A TaxID=1855613 RepID=UPI0033651FFC